MTFPMNIIYTAFYAR